MKRIGVTQRVDTIERRHERRDALDQRWIFFLRECQLLPIPLPNVASVAIAMVHSLDICGLVFTGGNDLATHGGNALERDATEEALLDLALELQVPSIGVCRGMQVIQQRFGVALTRVEGHVAPEIEISFEGTLRIVNTYHCFASMTSVPELEVVGRASDGVVKAVRHIRDPLLGIMWHPERVHPFSARDIDLFRRMFDAGGRAS